MEYPRGKLLCLTFLVTLASATKVPSEGKGNYQPKLSHSDGEPNNDVSSLNGGIVRCGTAHCGFKAKCVNDKCECISERGEIGYPIKGPVIYYCRELSRFAQSSPRQYSRTAEICKPGKCQENETCTSKTGKHICTCADGYQLSQRGQCLDIGECEKPDRCGDNSVCQNTDGNYTCECKEGYRKSEDNSLGCTDSRTLTIALPAGLGSLFVTAVVIVIIVFVFKRKESPRKGTEDLEINQREVNTRLSSHRSSSKHEVAVPKQKPSNYSVTNKETESGMNFKDPAEIYSNHKIKENKAKQKSTLLNKWDGDEKTVPIQKPSSYSMINKDTKLKKTRQSRKLRY